MKLSARTFAPAVGLVCALPLASPSASAAPTRPVVTEFRTFVYGDLPLLERTLFSSCSGAAIEVGPEKRYTSARSVKPPPISYWKVEGLPAEASLRIDDGHYVSKMPLYPTPRLTEAEWVVLDRAATTEEHASLSRCTARAKKSSPMTAQTSEEGTATALVPGRVYAYRRCVEGCGEPLGSPSRVEELGVLTSPALWISSSDWGANGHPYEDSFGRGFATVRPGTTATIVIGMHSDDASLGPLRSIEGEAARRATGADTFDVEVVWPLGGEPEMTLFTGHVDGDATALATAH